MTRIAFLGQGPIARACLEAMLSETPHVEAALEIPVVATSPDILDLLASDPRTTPRHTFDVKDRVDDLLTAAIRGEEVEWLVSVQYPWILRGGVLAAPRRGALNLHNAKLPDYRGHNSLSHEIINGETEHVITIHWMQEVVDTGFVAYDYPIPIAPRDTSSSLYAKALAAAPALFLRMIRDIISGQTPPKRAITGEGHYYGKRDIQVLKRISDPTNTVEMDRKARAFYFPPHEPAFIEVDGQKTHIVPEGSVIPSGPTWATITANGAR